MSASTSAGPGATTESDSKAAATESNFGSGVSRENLTQLSPALEQSANLAGTVHCTMVLVGNASPVTAATGKKGGLVAVAMAVAAMVVVASRKDTTPGVLAHGNRKL